MGLVANDAKLRPVWDAISEQQHPIAGVWNTHHWSKARGRESEPPKRLHTNGFIPYHGTHGTHGKKTRKRANGSRTHLICLERLMILYAFIIHTSYFLIPTAGETSERMRIKTHRIHGNGGRASSPSCRQDVRTTWEEVQGVRQGCRFYFGLAWCHSEQTPFDFATKSTEATKNECRKPHPDASAPPLCALCFLWQMHPVD